MIYCSHWSTKTCQPINLICFNCSYFQLLCLYSLHIFYKYPWAKNNKTPPSTFGNLASCFRWGLQVALLLCIGYLVSCCIPRSWGLVGMVKPWAAEAKEIHWHRPCQRTPGCLGFCYARVKIVKECNDVICAWYYIKDLFWCWNVSLLFLLSTKCQDAFLTLS